MRRCEVLPHQMFKCSNKEGGSIAQRRSFFLCLCSVAMPGISYETALLDSGRFPQCQADVKGLRQL